MSRRPGVQKQPRRLYGGAADYYDFRPDGLLLAGVSVHKRHSTSAAFVVNENLARKGILLQREIARRLRLRDHRGGTVKHCRDVASVHAVATVVARRAIIIRLGDDRFPHRHHGNTHVLEGAIENPLAQRQGSGGRYCFPPGRMSRPSSWPHTPIICSIRS